MSVPPARLTLADGSTIPHEVGAQAFNYYDMRPVTITRVATRAEPDTSGQLPNGEAWWVDTTGGTLDGSRMCSLETAIKKGFWHTSRTDCESCGADVIQERWDEHNGWQGFCKDC